MVLRLLWNIVDSRLETNLNNQLRTRDSIAYLQCKRYYMAQSAVKERALLDIETFWERPTLEPALRWERWQMQMLKLAILAKEGISIDTLRENPTNKVTLLPEPINETN